eukprot:1145929-Pelagomonas_calceolata.AAC.9
MENVMGNIQEMLAPAECTCAGPGAGLQRTLHHVQQEQEEEKGQDGSCCACRQKQACAGLHSLMLTRPITVLLSRT